MLLHNYSKCSHLFQNNEINHWCMICYKYLFQPFKVQILLGKKVSFGLEAESALMHLKNQHQIQHTCLGRMLGRGPWYLTTPVHDATKKLQINSTRHLLENFREKRKKIRAVHQILLSIFCYKSKQSGDLRAIIWLLLIKLLYSNFLSLQVLRWHFKAN